MPRGTGRTGGGKQLVTLAMLRELRRNAEAFRQLLLSELGDEVIDTRMKEVVVRLARYAEVAASRKVQSLSAEEIEAAGREEM